MEIQVTDIMKQNALGNDYTYVSMTSGKHSALVVVVKGACSRIDVIVQNASNRAWRRGGKSFGTLADAVAKYKTAEIRGMIEHAATVAA